jgi:hypothetical protein
VRGDANYCSVLDYGAWAEAIRHFKGNMAESTHEVLDTLANEFELAANKVDGKSSEYSHLVHLMNEFLTATSTIPHDDFTDELGFLFWVTLSDELAEAYEVLAFGDRRKDKSHLPPPSHRALT